MIWKSKALLKRRQHADAYSCLPSFYDRLMNHVDYVHWADYIHTLFQKHGNHVHHVVEGGCGTGSLAVHLSKKGYHLVGFDLANGMIQMACEKCPAFFWQGDLRQISLKQSWDAFLCLYDTIHYLNLKEIYQMLQEVGKVLQKDGLLIFDVVTESHVRQHWMNITEKDSGDDWEVVRQSWYEPQSHLQISDFTFTFKKDSCVHRECHYQHIFSLSALGEVIKSSGFTVLAKYSDFTLESSNGDSDRIHYVLTRREM